jgi:hypothetical protein
MDAENAVDVERGSDGDTCATDDSLLPEQGDWRGALAVRRVVTHKRLAG